MKIDTFYKQKSCSFRKCMLKKSTEIQGKMLRALSLVKFTSSLICISDSDAPRWGLSYRSPVSKMASELRIWLINDLCAIYSTKYSQSFCAVSWVWKWWVWKWWVHMGSRPCSLLSLRLHSLYFPLSSLYAFGHKAQLQAPYFRLIMGIHRNMLHFESITQIYVIFDLPLRIR